MDAEVATDERDSSGRRSRVVLTPRRWCQVRGKQNFPRMTVARKPGHRGERGISRKPLRREGRIASAEPVCSCAFSSVPFAHETAGAARTRSSLRPLVFQRVAIDAKLGRIAPRECGRISARCLTIEFETHPTSSRTSERKRTPIRDPYRVVLAVKRDGDAIFAIANAGGYGSLLSQGRRGEVIAPGRRPVARMELLRNPGPQSSLRARAGLGIGDDGLSSALRTPTRCPDRRAPSPSPARRPAASA